MNAFSRTLLQRHVVVIPLIAALLLGFGGTKYVLASHATGRAPASTSANTLTIGWNIETKTLDPVNAPQNPDIWVMVNIYDQLLRVAPDGKTLLPDLATSWNINKAGTVYTFHLRKGVRFQNGQILKASDVKFALDRARQTKQLWSWTLVAIKNIAAPNSSTVVINLKHPWAPFLSDVSLFDTGIYPASYYRQVGGSHMSAHPIGTGPYELQTWKRGQYILLKKNPAYFNASKFPMQYVEYELIPNDNTRMLKVEAGELDVDNVLPYNLVPAVKKSSSAHVQVDTSTQTNYIVPNLAKTPLKDLKVRQAIDHAINRAAIAKAVYYGYGTPANSFMPKGAIDYNSHISVPAYNMAIAKKLMKESKYPHGFTLPMETASGDSVGNETAVIIKQELAPLGINLKITQIDPTTLFNNQNAGKYHMTTNLWTNDIPDPDELVSFSVDYTQGSKAFYTWYDNPTLIGLSHQAERSNNPATRKQLYYKIQEMWAKDTPFFALTYSPFVNAVSNKVHGFKEMPLGYFILQGVTKS